MSRTDTGELVRLACAGDRRAVARLISLVETGGDPAREALAALYPSTGRAYSVGITGAPGAGKSTLTDRLVARVRADGERVAVLAVDPTSPFSGGAILGDRVRMQDHATDPGVFIRSMATRGHLGGLALATPQAIRVLDAAGAPWILVETVGVGQVEVEVAAATDTTVVVVNPGWGDSVQANKAGLLEIADVFVVNKADRPGADDAERDLLQMLELGAHRAWMPPIVRTVATDGEGIDALWDAIGQHRAHLEETGELVRRRRDRLRDEVRSIVLARLAAEVDARVASDGGLDALVARVDAREID
ncbi:MAG TPA: methylmalonyl Co-A mutase-associated GTPase MeaB, partial [Acidimicrobiia bacterium]|nr:methylmalonyl Co-A mutase-associated GTPase MeaB [Acidimicrobiia bacterium]